MLQQAMHEFNTEPDKTLMIGDSISDLGAAEAAGVAAILVKTGKGAGSLAKINEKQIYITVPVYENLHSAADAVLSTLSKNN